MFRIHLLVALRRLLKEKVYVGINIFSLALGIGSFLIFALYLRSELTYDQHYVDHESIYRLSTHFRQANAEDLHFAVSQEGIGPLMVADFPQLGAYVRFRRSTQNVLSYEDIRFSWDNIFLADENVFDVFSHDIVAGDPATAFADMNSIAVSESLARSYFGDEDPIGKILESDSYAYRVTLVFADQPENTRLYYRGLYAYRSLSQFVPDYEDNYIRGLGGVSVYTYLRVNPGFDPASFASISDDFTEKYMTEITQRMNATFAARLTPLDEIHFGARTPIDEPLGNILYIYGFSAVAAFILLIACINYMNLATARATKRAKEVGMRKVVGASRSQLVNQFLGESLVFTLVSLVLGVALAALALAYTPISSLMNKESLLGDLIDPAVLAGIGLLAVLVTLLSGLYPAFYLSSISPKAALRKIHNTRRGGLTVRQALVLAQIAISIGVIACTLLMSRQMRYIADKPLGFDKENKVWIQLRGADLIERVDILRDELIAEPDILNAMPTAQVPGFGNGINVIQMENNEGVIGPEQVDRLVVGLNFIEGMGIEVLEGRAFSEAMATDATSAVMVNAAMVRKMGWDNPLGKRVMLGEENEATVIGVTQDFHYTPLNNAIGPLLVHIYVPDFSNVPEQSRPLQTLSLIVTITGDNVGTTLAIIESKIKVAGLHSAFRPEFSRCSSE